MSKQNEQQPAIHRTSMLKLALLGAGIALVLIGVFLSGVNNPKPEWHPLWMLKPLFIVPLAGATGGVCYYYIDYWWNKGGWSRIVTVIIGLIVYVIGLWFGTVIGLNGTLWD